MRIIAALANVVVIVEAGERSSTLLAGVRAHGAAAHGWALPQGASLLSSSARRKNVAGRTPMPSASPISNS
jgi:predicted Rossmann fold nucleotide-binding protein DprA/Smf involved in DNA uptake